MGNKELDAEIFKLHIFMGNKELDAEIFKSSPKILWLRNWVRIHP